MTIGVGTILNLPLPTVTIGNRIVIAPTGERAVVTMGASHEQAIKDWLSVDVGVKLVGWLGTNVSSLLSQGVNTVIGFNLGWKVRVVETEKFLRTGSLDLVNGNITRVDANGFVKGTIDSVSIVSSNPLLSSKPTLLTGVIARAAYAFNPVFGAAVSLSGNMDLLLMCKVSFAVSLGVVCRQTPSVEDVASLVYSLCASMYATKKWRRGKSQCAIRRFNFDCYVTP